MKLKKMDILSSVIGLGYRFTEIKSDIIPLSREGKDNKNRKDAWNKKHAPFNISGKSKTKPFARQLCITRSISSQFH